MAGSSMASSGKSGDEVPMLKFSSEKFRKALRRNVLDEDLPAWVSESMRKSLAADIEYEKARRLFPNVDDLESFRLSLLSYATINKVQLREDVVESLFGGVTPDVYDPTPFSLDELSEALEALGENGDSEAYRSGYREGRKQARYSPDRIGAPLPETREHNEKISEALVSAEIEGICSYLDSVNSDVESNVRRLQAKGGED